MNEEMERLLAALMVQCRLGKMICPPAPVSGGLMHKMYRVETARGVYAVKHLNPEIMKREKARDDYKEAEMLEKILEKAKLPIVPAMVVRGQKMQQLEGQYFYIFHWQEGKITDGQKISSKECKMVGSILGQIHALAQQIRPAKAPERSAIDWQGYAERATAEQNEIAPLLTENLPLLREAEEKLNLARAALPNFCCISNADMDPKNVMWHRGKPKVIDLECLGWGNPVSDALQLALQWAGSVTGNLDMNRLTAFFDGYLAAYDNGFRDYSGVFGLAYTWVEWLEYNMQRALGQCADAAECSMGKTQVKETIERIAYMRRVEASVKEGMARYFSEC